MQGTYFQLKALFICKAYFCIYWSINAIPYSTNQSFYSSRYRHPSQHPSCMHACYGMLLPQKSSNPCDRCFCLSTPARLHCSLLYVVLMAFDEGTYSQCHIWMCHIAPHRIFEYWKRSIRDLRIWLSNFPDCVKISACNSSTSVWPFSEFVYAIFSDKFDSWTHFYSVASTDYFFQQATVPSQYLLATHNVSHSSFALSSCLCCCHHNIYYYINLFGRFKNL